MCLENYFFSLNIMHGSKRGGGGVVPTFLIHTVIKSGTVFIPLTTPTPHPPPPEKFSGSVHVEQSIND